MPLLLKTWEHVRHLYPGRDVVSGSWISLVFVLFTAYLVSVVIHRLYLHPLSRFPGPKYAALSNAPFSYWFLGGKQPLKILDLHLRYGPIVRTAPNELSFNTARSWRDIYGSRQGEATFTKSKFYEGGSFADQYGSIVSERDPATHAQMRRYLSAAFSQQSLAEQEDLVQTTVEKFLGRLSDFAAVGEIWDAVLWFNMLTFDIIGELAFGESFDGVDTGIVHPWISRITGAMAQGALADTFKRFPVVAALVMRLFPGAISKAIADTKINERMSIDLVSRRLDRKTDRKDFMTRIVEARTTDGISDVQIAAHASDFVLAGSETTATALATIVYYLDRTPTVKQRLRQELKENFTTKAAITLKSTLRLPYLTAVVCEALRIYPPLPFALPRDVPGTGAMVDGVWVAPGTVVSTNPIAACLDPANFKDPLVFDPERWLAHTDGNDLDASQPFSLGTRGCLGQSLGWMELRIIVAKLFWGFDVVAQDKTLDWHHDSKMHTLWKKPALLVKCVSVDK